MIEALIKSSGMVDYRNFFIDNAGELESLLSDGKAVVRDKAVKILRSLGLSATGETGQGWRGGARNRGSKGKRPLRSSGLSD